MIEIKDDIFTASFPDTKFDEAPMDVYDSPHRITLAKLQLVVRKLSNACYH